MLNSEIKDEVLQSSPAFAKLPVSHSDFSVGDTVVVNPNLISEITYTNKPQIGVKYKIRCEWIGDTWTFGLNYLSGQDANIHISWKHLLHCG